MHFPDFDSFQRGAASYPLAPVYRRVLSDGLTPVLALKKLDDGGPVCLFESVIGGEKVGRYSFLGTDPFLEMTASGELVTVTERGASTTFSCADPLEELRRRLHGFQAAHFPDLPPFTGGAVGYAGYDVVRYVERLPNAPTNDRQLPDLSFAFYDHMLIFDHVDKTLCVVAMARLDQAKGDSRLAYE